MQKTLYMIWLTARTAGYAFGGLFFLYYLATVIDVVQLLSQPDINAYAGPDVFYFTDWAILTVLAGVISLFRVLHARFF